MDLSGTPTPSGVGVPSLVCFATTHHVGACCFVFVSRSFVSTDCTCVVLIDLVTMGPAIVSRERLV